jgi:hypothetical protein
MKREQIILRVTQLWTLLLIVGSLQPARPAPIVGLHRELHWLAFGGTAVLLLLLSQTRRRQIGSLLATLLLGLTLEYLQHLIYRNAIEWRDVRDDSAAVGAAFTLYCLAIACKVTFTTSIANPASHLAPIPPAPGPPLKSET